MMLEHPQAPVHLPPLPEEESPSKKARTEEPKPGEIPIPDSPDDDEMMIDDIRQVLRTYHKFIPESRLKLFMMKRDFLTIGSMWSLGQVSVGVLC